MVNIKDILPSLDLLAEVSKDAPVGGSFRGQYSRNAPCPFCGGSNRFNVRIGSDGIQRAFCRQCGPTNSKTGKPAGWNAIDYVMKRDGIDFKAALAYWRCDDRPAATDRRKPEAPPIVAPPQTWQAKALAFVSECEAALWTEAGAKAREYLHGRGLSDETIKRFKLGFNPSWRKCAGAEWGIERDFVKAAAGVTIPRFIMGELWAVNVRRLGEFDGPKYLMMTGSILGMAGADDLKGAGVALAFGGEFDMMLAAQHAPAGVACVTFGGETVGVGELWRNMLKDVGKVLVCYDADKAGKSGAFNWYEAHQSPRRVKVPSGKDLTEFAQAGGDVGAWIASQVARAMGKRADNNAETTQIVPATHQQAPQMAQDAAIEPIADTSPAQVGQIVPELHHKAPQIAQDNEEMAITRAVVGFLENEGAAMPSKVAAQILAAMGWEWGDEVRERVTCNIRRLVKTGRVVQLPTKALALKVGDA